MAVINSSCQLIVVVGITKWLNLIVQSSHHHAVYLYCCTDYCYASSSCVCLSSKRFLYNIYHIWKTLVEVVLTILQSLLYKHSLVFLISNWKLFSSCFCCSLAKKKKVKVLIIFWNWVKGKVAATTIVDRCSCCH